MSDDIRKAIAEVLAPAAEMQRLSHKAVLTPAEVAILYGITVSTLEKMRGENRGPAYSQLARNGKVLYSRQSIDAWPGPHRAFFIASPRLPARCTQPCKLFS